MQHIYGFSDYADNFRNVKITQNILCLLSTLDMKKLGITNTVDMMKFKNIRVINLKWITVMGH